MVANSQEEISDVSDQHPASANTETDQKDQQQHLGEEEDNL